MRSFAAFMSLALLVGTSPASAENIKRISANNFEAQGFVEAITYEGGVQTCSESESVDKQLNVNHNNSALLTIDLIALCSGGGPTGEAFANAEMQTDISTNIHVTQDRDEVSMKADIILLIDLYAVSGGFTGDPEFDAEATSSTDSNNSSNFQSLATQERTLAATYALSAEHVNGLTDLEPGSYFDTEVKDSKLTAVYMGGYWVVFGDLEDSDTQYPNEPARGIFYLSTGEDLSYAEDSTEVLGAEGQFVGKLMTAGMKITDTASAVGGHDGTRWNLSGEITFSLSP